MSLKTDFFDGATGLQSKLNAAFDSGSSYVTDNLATLSDALVAAAAQGQTKFTVKINGVGGVNAAALRANNGSNLLLKSFFAGVAAGLATQDVYNYECSLELDISDSVNTSVKFNFNFQTS